MVDSNPTDHAAHSTSPAAPLSADEIAGMVRKLRLARAEVHTLPNSAARLYGDAADALEALTAERDRLAAEATINDGRATYWRKRYVALGNEVIDRSGVAEADWYNRHRRRVEAAHAAAKQSQREAECRNCRDGFPAYAAWPDWHICPMCGRNCDAAAKEAEREAALQELADLGQEMQPDCYATGIDMALLGKLCREEPDEATKRAVEAMMDGIRDAEGKGQ